MGCLKLSNDCSKGPFGPIGYWDVSAVTDMENLFNPAKTAGAALFNGDLSKWDVSQVTIMEGVFESASSFNGDISKWDVSRVTNMDRMFVYAKSFARTLCGAWKAAAEKFKNHIFTGSSGKICDG